MQIGSRWRVAVALGCLLSTGTSTLERDDWARRESCNSLLAFLRVRVETADVRLDPIIKALTLPICRFQRERDLVNSKTVEELFDLSAVPLATAVSCGGLRSAESPFRYGRAFGE